MCVCGGGGCVFPRDKLFHLFLQTQKVAGVFHSLKIRVFLCGDEGEGTEAFLVNNVERSLLIGCFNLMCVVVFICLFISFSDVSGKS